MDLIANELCICGLKNGHEKVRHAKVQLHCIFSENIGGEVVSFGMIWLQWKYFNYATMTSESTKKAHSGLIATAEILLSRPHTLSTPLEQGGKKWNTIPTSRKDLSMLCVDHSGQLLGLLQQPARDNKTQKYLQVIRWWARRSEVGMGRTLISPARWQDAEEAKHKDNQSFLDKWKDNSQESSKKPIILLKKTASVHVLLKNAQNIWKCLRNQ